MNMKPQSVPLAAWSILTLAALASCSKEEQTPPPMAPTQQAYPPQAAQPGYQQPAQPGYQQAAPVQPGYQQPAQPAAQPGYQQPPAQPGYPAQPAPAAPAAAPLSQPSPIATPCTADAQCLTHRCNVAAGKCAWPCQGSGDCQPGFQCVSPMCIPNMPAQTPPVQ